MHRSRRFVVALTLFLFACVSVGRIDQLALGMSKAEVIAVMGSPQVEASHEDYDILAWQSDVVEDPFMVLLQAGKVIYFGRASNLDSMSSSNANLPQAIQTSR